MRKTNLQKFSLLSLCLALLLIVLPLLTQSHDYVQVDCATGRTLTTAEIADFANSGPEWEQPLACFGYGQNVAFFAENSGLFFLAALVLFLVAAIAGCWDWVLRRKTNAKTLHD